MLMIIIMLCAAAGTERDTGPAKLIIKSDRFPQSTLKVSHVVPGGPGKGISARVTVLLKVSHVVTGGPGRDGFFYQVSVYKAEPFPGRGIVRSVHQRPLEKYPGLPVLAEPVFAPCQH
jgi:hypothetical protein